MDIKMRSLSDFFPLLCYRYTKILKVRRFNIYQWSSDKLAKHLTAGFSHKLKTFHFLWLASRFRFKCASHHAKSICAPSIYPALWTEEIMVFKPKAIAFA